MSPLQLITSNGFLEHKKPLQVKGIHAWVP